MTRWEDRYVQVLTEGGHRQFFDRFLLSEGVSSLVVVTPWISGAGPMEDHLVATIEKIRRGKIRTTVIVRHPRKEPMNYQALLALAKLPTVEIHFNNELHAKVYVCRCDPYGFGYVGSANLTGKATTAYEVGLLIEGKGEGERIVDELERLGRMDLLGRAGTFRDGEFMPSGGET